MVVMDRNTKDMVIPKSLGNFVTEGSGGGVTPEEAAQIASAVTEEAIDAYDTELQVDLKEIRDAVSGNSQDIAILSGLSTEIAAISGQTTANTQDIGILSGDVETNTLAIANLENNVVPELQGAITAAGQIADSANTKVEALSAVTSGLVEDVEVLERSLIVFDFSTWSGTTKELFDAISDAYYNKGKNVALYGNAQYSNGKTQLRLVSAESGSTFTFEGEAQPSTVASSDLYLYKVILYAAGGTSGVSNKIFTRQKINSGSVPTASSSTKGGIKVGSGLTMSGDYMSIKAGEGLGFSGDTLVVSGASSNTKVVMLNDLTEQERVALYNELSSLYDYNANGWTSAYTEDMYAFYLDLRTFQQQGAAQTIDKYEGFFPMQCVRMHPTDYGGAAFFTGVEQSREGNGQLICIRYVITYDGQVDGPATWWNNPVENPEGTYVKFTSGGTMVEGDAYNFARACGNNSPNGYYALQYNGIFIVDENNYDTVLCYTNLDCSVPLSTSDYPDMGFGFRAVFNFYLGGNFYRVIGDIVQGGSDEGWHLISCTQI